MGTIDPTSLEIRNVFQACQDDSVTVGKSVRHLRKIWSKMAENDDPKNPTKTQSHFFQAFVRYMQIPLTFKERTDHVNKCLETACKFASSFLKEELEAKKDEAAATAEPEDEDGIKIPYFMNILMNWLLDHHEATSSQARLRICLMVNSLLGLMPQDASIDDELYEKIYNNMLERLKDKVAEIRAQAVTALERLQDPTDKECPIIKAFVYHLCFDPSALVRRTVLKVIGASKTTLLYVMKRTRDVDDSVRRAAFKFLAEKVHIRSLRISQREQVLQRGLSDRSEAVRKVVERDLITNWLKLSNDNVVELLYHLDIKNSDEKTPLKLLQAFFKGLPPKEICENFNYRDERQLVPFEKLTAETAMYWRAIVTYLHSEGGDYQVLLDDFLPELTTFCHYVRQYIIELPRKQDDEEALLSVMFVAKQLIEIALRFDFSDEVGRFNLAKLCKDLISHKLASIDLIQPLMEIFTIIKSDVSARIQEIAELIAEIREPLREEVEKKAEEPEMKAQNKEELKKKQKALADQERAKKVEIAKVRVKLNELKHDMESAVEQKDFMKAQELKIQIDELDKQRISLLEELTEGSVQSVHASPMPQPAPKPQEEDNVVENRSLNDPIVTKKCLELIFQLLQDPNIKSLNPTLMTFMDELILPSVRDLEPEIRKTAVNAMGACCLRSIDVAKRHIVLLFEVSNLDEADVRVAALAAITNQLMHHDITAFNHNQSTDDERRLSGTGSVDGNTEAEATSPPATPIVTILTELLDDPNMDVRTKVAEGLCKLLTIGKIHSPKLLQRLVLMYYNPIFDDDAKLRHVLGTFFLLYAATSRTHQDSFAEAFAPTLRTFYEAPPTSPLSSVPIDEVGTFFIQLTNESFLQVSKDAGIGCNCHDAMALTILNEVISNPHHLFTKTFVKLLHQLQLTKNDFARLRDIKSLNNQVKDLIKDKLIIKSFDKFDSFIDELLKHDTGPESEAEEDQEAVSMMEIESNVSQESVNSSKTSMRRRNLFSQVNNTLLPSPSVARVSSDTPGMEGLAPLERHPKRPLESRSSVGSITNDEDEEDKVVSGNIGGGRKAGTKTTIVSEMSGEFEVSGGVVSDNTDFSDDLPITSTQSEELVKVDSFINKRPGSNVVKLLRKDSTSEESEKEQLPKAGEEKEEEKKVKKLKRQRQTKTNLASNKKATGIEVEEVVDEDKRKSPKSSSRLTQSSQKPKPAPKSTRKAQKAPVENPSPPARGSRSRSRLSASNSSSIASTSSAPSRRSSRRLASTSEASPATRTRSSRK